ncbi:MAG TPA: recombinase family protein [Gaiellaceae bacterium]|nr:recombinase family protein [Gaiellaceae bacterium]
MTVDGYIRVSRVGGRTGESFISPDEQRRAIEAYASANRIEVGEWFKDLDQSGGTLERPAFQQALERCRNGQSGGIIAAKLDRLTRSTVGLGELIAEARAGGWNLVAVDQGLDLFSPNGKMVADILVSVAEWERTRAGESWAASRRNALERGIPNGRLVIAYRKDRDNGRPVIVERLAVKVRDAFERRAAGEAFSAIGRRYGWSHSTVRQMIGNEAYIGVARSGPFVNEHAYPPIVSRGLFAAANAARTRRPAPSGETTRGRLLRGIAKCGGCGHTLKIVRRSRADGTYAVSYYCKNAASEPCGDRAFVHADELDRFVGEWFTAALQRVPRMVDVVSAGRELEAAQAEQATAEAELTAYVENVSVRDPALFQRGYVSREQRAREAQDKVRQLSARLDPDSCGRVADSPLGRLRR